MKNNKIIALLLLVVFVLSIAGCGNLKQSQELSKRQERIENNELIVAIGEEPEAGFDSTTGGHGSITKLFFSTLFKRDKQLGWTNDLATDYQVSEDKLTWIITIREDAYFTDGTKVTAKDVAYTYNTAKDAGADIDLTIVETISPLDEYRIEFKLYSPYSPFLERLAYLGIVPEHAHNEQFREHPIGSGPYQFVEWSKGQQIILNANEAYYGEVPKIKKLTLVFLARDTAYEAVKNKSIDVAAINGALAEKPIEGTKVIDIESIECYGISFPMVSNEGNTSHNGVPVGNNVTSDIGIRRALNVAVDRQRIVEGILNGYGSVSTTGLEQMPWLNEATVLEASEYANLEAAKKILNEAGWEDSNQDGILEKEGVEAKFKLLYTEGIYRQEMALEFVNVANQIGIKIELEKVTWDTILDKIHQEAVLYGFGSGDPSELYNLYYGANAGGLIPWDNSGYYNNALANQAIDQALNAIDEAEAIAYWMELQQYTSVKGDAPYCWLANVNHVYLAAEGFNFGEPVIQPHGGRIFDNVVEWSWENK